MSWLCCKRLITWASSPTVVCAPASEDDWDLLSWASMRFVTTTNETRRVQSARRIQTSDRSRLAIDYTSPHCGAAGDSFANWLESRDCHSSGILIGCQKNLNLTYFNRLMFGCVSQTPANRLAG